MSPEQPEPAATRPSTGLDQDFAVVRTGDRDIQYPLITLARLKQDARDIVRLFQCTVCSRPINEPVTLPCGASICRSCIPESHLRANITYPALPDRQHGFHCPLAQCAKEHAVGDCSTDVILNKAIARMVMEVEKAKKQAAELKWATRVTKQTTSQVTGIPSLRDEDDGSHTLSGGRFLATWGLTEQGDLEYDVEVTYEEVSTSMPSPEEIQTWETEQVRNVQMEARLEMDCQICYALFHDPLTTACGHTFCRTCLHRILDHSSYCPICRRKLTINPLLTRTSYPPNNRLHKIIETFWADELASRKDAIAAEQLERHRDFDTSLFVCTLSFPLMPTFLHVFEPRYRLMIRRALEGDGTFGMVLPRRTHAGGGPAFYELGTLLRIVNIQPFPDGRSLIETRGVSRFRVQRHEIVDGYIVGKTERIEDVGLEEEEAIEAAEVMAQRSPNPSGNKESLEENDQADVAVEMPETVEGLNSMPTTSLMRLASAFVERMRVQSVPWLTERILEMCPADPAVFPWWFASMLPVKDHEKYRLLGTSSVRERLKICCAWIMEWERNRWSLQDCVIL